MSPDPVILVAPIGDIPDWVIQSVTDGVRNVFGVDARVERPLDSIAVAYDRNRNQYWSTKILDILEETVPPGYLKALAVTREDLFIPILTHVYGEARLGGRVAVVSISRLLDDPDFRDSKPGRSRILKEAAHELGHTFDLKHCEDPGCIMHYCRGIDDVDRKSDRFCRYCRIFLADAVINLPGSAEKAAFPGPNHEARQTDPASDLLRRRL